MNRKQFTLLIVLVLVLGGAGIYLRKRNANAWSGSGTKIGQKLLGEFSVNDVRQITIRQHTNEVNLSQKGETWTVKERNDYPADFNEISDAVRKLGDLKIVQSDKVGTSQHARLELVEPGKGGSNSATLVELKGEGSKALKSLLLGKKHIGQGGGRGNPMMGMSDEGFPNGRFIMTPGSDSVAVVSDPLTQLEAKPEQWLSKDFFKVEKVKAVSLVSTNATNSWKLSREIETGEWKLEDAKHTEQLDQNKVSSLQNALAQPAFVDVVINASPEQTGLAVPTTVTFETFDGLTYTIRVGGKSGDENYFMTIAISGSPARERTPGKDEKPEDKEKLDKEFKDRLKQVDEKIVAEKKFEKWTYLVSKWTLDTLLKDRAALMQGKQDEAKPEGLPPGIGSFPEKPGPLPPSADPQL